MPDIVLSTLNAKYIHAAFGLRYLMANLGTLRAASAIAEFDINQRPLDIAESLLARNPKIIGIGVYIWNVAATTEVVAAIKRVRPDIVIILGGPEVSFESESLPIVQLADHVIMGEADLKFAEVCRVLLERHTPARREAATALSDADAPLGAPPLQKIIPAGLPDLSQLVLPYDFYTNDDVAHRIVYVEASRGCPFTCEFCLSSLDIPVRQVPLPSFFEHMRRLLDRGVRRFKFVDRTFNLDATTSRAILEFFLERFQPGHFLHFEMIPDRLPAALRGVISKFPPGALQFEVGVQTFNEAVAERIKRRQDYGRLEDTFRFLRRQTGVHIHADLIAGLPGETLESFAGGFDRLVALGPQEIQVGVLKRLRGTPIARHDAEWRMVYNPNPPYELLQSGLIDFATMQKVRRFARYWDLVGNSGNFVETAPLIWSAGRAPSLPPSEVQEAGAPGPAEAGTTNVSPFHAFERFSEWLYARAGRTGGIALAQLMELLFEFLVNELDLDAAAVARTMWRDYQGGGRRDKPGFLKAFLPADEPDLPRKTGTKSPMPKRQARHLV